MSKPAPRRATGPAKRSIRTLGKRLGPAHAALVADLAERISLAQSDRHDYRRSWVGKDWASHLYVALKGEDAIRAGVPPATLAFLGYGEDPIRPETPLDDVFTLRLGEHIIWGSAETGWLVWLAEPNSVFR